MADYKLGVDQSSPSNYKFYESAVPADFEAAGTVTGLRENLSINSSTGQIAGITVGSDGKITINSNDVLPASPTKNDEVTVQVESGKTLSLELGANVTQSKENGFTATPGIGTITIKTKYSAGWYLSGDKICYDTESTSRSGSTDITVNGNGLRSDRALTTSDFEFDESKDSNKVITLKSTAFAESPAANATVTVSSNNFSLAIADTLVAKKAADTDFEWGIQGIKSDGTTVTSTESDIATKTATLQKSLNAGWSKSSDVKPQTLTYRAASTIIYATITGLSKETTATTLADILPAKDATVTSDYELKLSKADIPMPETGTAVVTLTNGQTSGKTTVDGSDISPAFKLAKDTDIATEPEAITAGTVSLVIATPETNATKTNATVTQHLNAGWTLDTTNNTITYTAAKDVPLATIKNLAAGVTASSAVLKKSDKTITLESGALLADASNTITLTPTELTTLTTNYDASYTADYTAYKLALGNVDKTENQSTGEYNAVNTDGTAILTEGIAQYWELSADTKTVTYTAPTQSAALATVEGLKSDATVSVTDATADVYFNTSSSHLVVLKEGAFKKGLTSGSKVTLESTAYKISLNGVAKSKATRSAPEVTISGTTASIKTTPSAGWDLDDDKTVTYNAPEAVTLAEITGLKNGTVATNVTIGTDGKTITLKNAALDSSTVTLAEKTSAEGNTYEDNYDFVLALDTDVTKYGSGEKTPTLTIAEADTTADPAEPTGTKTAKIQVVESAGWKLADNKLSVTKTDATTVDWIKVTGLGTDAVYVSTKNDGSNTVTFDSATKTIKVKQAALAEHDAQLTKATGVTDTAADGYKIAFDGDVDAPGTYYSGATLGTVNENGAATITATLNKGWTQTDDDTISYTAAKTGQELATISGLSANATGVTLGTMLDNSATDADEHDTNIIYVPLTALADNNVTLTNKTIATKDDTKKIDESITGDFKFMLGSSSKKSTTLGFEKNYAWTLNTAGTTAYYKQANEKGWTVSTDGATITHKAKVDPATETAGVTTLMTVTGLKGSLEVGTITVGSDTLPAIGTKPGDTFTPGLWISSAYVPAQAAVEANPDQGVVAKDAVPEAAGKVMLKRNVLNDTASAKVTLEVKDTDFGKYEFALYDNAKDSDATADTYVPSKGMDKYVWAVDTNGAATYKKATTEYWALDDTKKSATYNAQKDTETLARITGLKTDLKAMEGDDFTTAKSAAGDSWKVTGSYVYSGEEAQASSNKVVEVTSEYVADDASTTNVDETVLGTITLKAGALNEKDVAFTAGDKKYRLALDGVTGFTANDPTWSLSGTTATYKQNVTAAGYNVTKKDKDTDTVGQTITYTGTGDRTLATITNLKSGINLGPDGKVGGNAGITTANGVFTLNGNVLGTSTVSLTNGTGQSYKLAVGTGALDYKNETEKAIIDGKQDVWRITKNSKGVPTAYYRNVTPAYYNPAEDGLSIAYKPEATAKTYTTIAGLKDNITISETDPDAATFSSKLGANADSTFTEGIKVGKDADGNDILTVSNNVLDTTRTVSLTDGSTKYTFVLDTASDNKVGTVGVTGTPTWTVDGNTATLTGKLTAGWVVDASNTGKSKRITHFDAVESKVIATLSGVKSGVETSKLPTLPLTADGSFEITTDVLDGKDVTLNNGKSSDGTDFTYGIKLDNSLATAAATAVDGVDRWYLDGTTLNYSTIHDAHYEDLATKTSKSTSTEATKTTIKYVAETIDETPLISVTGLKEDLTLLGNAGAGNKYYKSTAANATADGTPVTGITVDSTDKTVTLAESVLNKDSAKPTTITNKTKVFGEKYKLKGDNLATPGSAAAVKTFKVDGTKAELWTGKSAGFEVSNDKISYVSATQDTVVTTINGIASGLVVNEDGNKIGTAENGKFKTAAITFDNDYKFTLTQDALTTTNVTIDDTIDGITSTLVLDAAVTTAWNTNKEAYSWKVNGTTATYSKGNKEGWEIPEDGDDRGSIVYHKEEYATDLATVTNLASGLKVDSTNKEKLLDKTGKNTAVTITDHKDIKLTSFALNKKNVTVTRVKKTESETEYNTPTTFTVALDKSTKIEDGKTVNADTYVENSSITPDWAKDSKDASKATYTITTKAGYDVATSAIPEGADAFVEYTADAVAKATLTGLKDGIDYKTLITITAPTAEDIEKGADPNTAGTMTLKPGALNGKDVKLTNSKTDYTLALESPASASTPMWHVSNGTATYKETYAKGGYVKKSDTEITYLAEARVDTLATVTGLDKNLKATADAGINDATAKTEYGISASTITRTKASTETTASGQLADAEPTTTTETVNVIRLSDKTKLAAGNVTVKDGTKTYELYMTDSIGTAEKVGDFAQVEYKDNPQWGYSKGTATLDGGKSAGWVYKSDDDHKTLTYKKAQPVIVATVKGLNATNLELVDGAIKSFTTTTSGTTETKTYSTDPVITYTKSAEDGEPGTINLTDGALVTGNGLKDKVKVTLTSDDYVLNAGTISEPSDRANEWSVDTKGVASYQYNTTAGWTLDDTGKNFTYSASKDTVLAKISGLVKGDDTTTYTKTTADGKTTYTPATVASLAYIEVTEDSTADGTHKKYIFTLKDASKLSTSNISLTKSDKTSGNEYELQADSSIAPDSYGTKWTVNGSGGKATLTSGSKAGYENATGTKAGTVVNYVKETASKTLATITGLKKDTSTTAADDKLEKVFSNVVTVNSDTKTIDLKNAEKILTTGDKATTVSLSSKEGYKFGTVSGTPIKTNITPELAYKSGTLTVVETAKAGDYTLSTDAMKLVYNKKDTTTVLATVKGLSKNLALKDGKLVTATSVKKGETPTYGTTAVATLDTNTGKITLEKDALAETKIGFSLGKGVEDGSYSLALGTGVMTESGNWREQTGWVNKNGTATYKTYDMGYYYDDGKGGFAYTSASKGKTLVTITGLQKDANVSGFATGTSGKITLDSTTLNGKKVTLKNNAAGYNFKLALDTTSANKVTESGLTGHAWKSGNLTASQTVGYTLDSDTQISYIAKQKDNQKIASLSGIKKDSTIKYEGATINLTGTHLNNANVVLTTTGLDDVDYKINLTGTTAPSPTPADSSKPWTAGKNTETLNGYVTAGYTPSASGKSVTYTKANGTAEKPKALVTVKGVEEADMSGSTASEIKITGGSPTVSSGLLPVTYSGTGTITGSKDADTISVSTDGAAVNGGKGDDSITLGTGAFTVIYGNGDGNDVIANFDANDTIKLTGGKVAGVKSDGTNAFVTVGKQTIQLTGVTGVANISIVDKNGKQLNDSYVSSSDVLLADDNYSMDAASLSDITEPFKASYTPYDFEAGLDLVKQNSIAPALTFTGTSDKK